MQLKSFNDFLASLTQEDKDYIHCLNDEDAPRLEVNLVAPNAMNEVAGFISAQSFKMTVRMLEVYHEWLAEQLD